MFDPIRLNFKSPLLPLFLVILIDHIGLALIFPILVPIFMDPVNGMLGAAATLAEKNFLYGITLSVFPVAMFFGATLLGGLSDELGRKKVLVICLLGAGFGYTFSGIAVDIVSLPLLIFSRALAGLTAGSMPIAQAAVIDVSTESNKTKNIGYVILSGSIGFVLGPLIGSFFSDKTISSWFSYSTPLYFAAGLAFINIVLLRSFKETFISKGKTVISFKKSIQYLIDPFKMESIRFLAIIYLVMQLGWSAYFQYISKYLLAKYEFNSQAIALFMSLMGLGFAIGSGWLPGFLTKYIRDSVATVWLLLISTLIVLVTIIDLHIHFVWIGSLFSGIVMAAAYAIMIRLFSNTVSDEKQGWIMGVSEAIVAVTWAITPLLSSYLENLAIEIPLVLAMILLMLSAILLVFWKPIYLTISNR